MKQRNTSTGQETWSMESSVEWEAKASMKNARTWTHPDSPAQKQHPTNQYGSLKPLKNIQWI